jgi:TetR/AcrR family transcriptional regulator, mexJK operon transcriptional repressor
MAFSQMIVYTIIDMEKKYALVLETAYKLFSEKGYFFVSTKEIAESAGISEMTIFRNFKTKINLFIKVLENYIFIPNLKNLFENEFSWVLREDLPKIFKAFYDSIKQNHMLVFIKMTEPHKMDKALEAPKLMERLPEEMFNWAKKYFEQMKKKGLIKEDPSIISANLCSGIFGLFFSYEIAKFNKDIEFDCLSNNFLDIYIRGVK